MDKEKKYADSGAESSSHGTFPRMQTVAPNIDIVRPSAKTELENLLKTHPDLDELQEEIERLLRNSGAFENRMAVLGLMIEARLLELQNRITHLFSIK